MAEVILHLEMADKNNLDRTAALVEQRLSKLDSVAGVEAAPEETRMTGLEIAAAIAVGVSIVKSGRELVAELRKLIPEIQGLIGDIKGVKNVQIEIGGERVPLAALNEAHLEQLGEG